MIFFISDLIVTGLVVLFPELSTWLPTAFIKKPFWVTIQKHKHFHINGDR